MKIGWTPRSSRAFKRLVKRNPQLRVLVEQTLQQMVLIDGQKFFKTRHVWGVNSIRYIGQIDWFKNHHLQDEGYQTSINRVLREYVTQGQYTPMMLSLECIGVNHYILPECLYHPVRFAGLII